MIPVVISVGDEPRQRVERPPGRTLRRVGLALLLFSIVGGVVWLAGYSPVGFERFSSADADRRIDFRDSGTYLVYEEYPGAATPSLPTPWEVRVRGRGGVRVKVTPAQAPGTVAAPDSYSSILHEGRALASFDVDDPGSYLVEIVPVRVAGGGQYAPAVPSILAVGDAASASWRGGPLGAAMYVLLPAAAGVACVEAARRARRRARTTAGAAQDVR